MSLPEPKRLSRSALIRDTIVFQVKLAVDGLLDVAMVPVSLVAAAISFVGGEPVFYRVMRTGRALERKINLFGAARRYRFGRDDAFDKLALRVEREIRNEIETHRLQTSAKEALERVLASVQNARGNGAEQSANAERSERNG